MGEYTVQYGIKYLYTTGSVPLGTDQQYYSVASGAFRIVTPPPTKPAAGCPAFAWQGSVGGVNTGTGNKTTTLPIVGWTQRGGLPVSFGLIHNSQNSLGSPAGPKWQMSYFSYLTNTGGNPTLIWDNGLSYSFTKTGSGNTAVYTPPYGIMDKLVSVGNNQFTLTTPGNVKYTFGYAPSNAYLSAITDMDGNTLTINHNGDTSLSSIVDNAGRTITLGYGGGKLASVTDPLGRLWTFGYTGAGDLWYVVEPAIGSAYSVRAFAYNGAHDITQTQDHNNNQSFFGYNGDNSLAWVRDPLSGQTGPATTFTYNVGSTVMTDPNGHTLTHTYAASRLASVTDARGLTEFNSYDYNNILSTKKDKRGFSSSFSSHFDTGNNNVSTSTGPVINGVSAVSQTVYDGLNKVTKSVDALGNTTTNAYTGDAHEDLLTSTVTGTGASPFTATSKVGGYTNGLPTTFTDANGNSSSVTYDANGWGYPVSAADANKITTYATFNAMGWKLTSTDALKRVTRYTYDNWGRLVVVTAPDGTQTGTVYDPNGNVQRVADADAYAATPLYAVHCYGNAVGRFSGDGYAAGGSGSWASAAADLSGAADPAPAAVYTTQRLGTFTYTFPNLTPGKLYTLRLHFVESGHTGPGQRLFNVAVNGSPALTAFDIFASAGAANKAVVPEFTPSANGSGQIVVSFTPGAADVPVCSGLEVLPFVHTVANNYDADDRLVSTLGGTGTGNGDIVSYAYDGTDPLTGAPQKGLLSSKTDGNGHTTRYSYTARNEPYQTFYADGTTESIGTTATNGYDANGNVLLRVKPDGKVIGYAYDAADRLTDVTYPTLPAVHFDYDAGGRRTHMHDGYGDTYWTFGDGLHLTQLQSGRGTVTYGYDLGGRRTRMTAVGVNSAQPYNGYAYNYDPGGRLKTLQNPFGETTTFGYNDDGTVNTKSLWNGAYTSYWYDPASGQMTDLRYTFPALGGTYGHHYTYTPAGSLAARSEGDGGTNTFAYDGLDQLTSEVRTGPVPFLHSYTYDHNGNRLTKTVNGSLLQSFTYDAHDKLTGGLGEIESYDPNGNLTAQTLNGQTTHFAWDDEDRLIAQQFPDGHSDAYSYTGLGMRLRKSDPAGNFWYFADGVSPASPVLSDGYSAFTPGISETRGAAGGGFASVYYLADAQGNSRGLLDASQGNPDGYNWDAFGNAVSRFGTNPTAYGWNEESGYQADADSGLKLLGHRYLDSRTGRFLSQDPAGDGGNWYAYCGNSPMNGADPSGLLPSSYDGIDLGVAHMGQAPGSPYYTASGFTVQGVYQIWTDAQGNVDPSKPPKFLYNIAYPNKVDLEVNLEGAFGYGAFLARKYPLTGRYFNKPLNILNVGPREAKYFGGHVGHTTVGDFKLNVDTRNPLYQWADNGGNFNAGIIGSGFGMGRGLLARSGDYARSKDSGWPRLDDPQGARVLQDGYTYGLDLQYGVAMPGY